MSIDFSKYTLEELMQSLESVDDIEFPENALTIYKLVLDKLELDHKNVGAKTLGYEIGIFSELVFMELISLPFESIVKDLHLLNSEMRDKITRLNTRLCVENT